MEKIKKENSKKVDAKKLNIEMKNKDKLTELKEFYNEKIKKWHIITFIIVAVLYTITFFAQIYTLKNGGITVNPNVTPVALVDQIKESFLLSAVILIAGITPYIPLSVFGVAQAFIIVDDMILRNAYGISFVPTLYVGGLLQIVGIALSVVLGVYYCRLNTKKNKYYHHSDFGLDDVKMQLYEIRKDEKKIEEIVKKKEAKAKEIEACNIKIPYLKLAALSLLAFAFEFIGIIVTKI